MLHGWLLQKWKFMANKIVKFWSRKFIWAKYEK